MTMVEIFKQKNILLRLRCTMSKIDSGMKDFCREKKKISRRVLDEVDVILRTM